MLFSSVSQKGICQCVGVHHAMSAPQALSFDHSLARVTVARTTVTEKATPIELGSVVE